ncbi:MAG: hypothetical protein WD231_02555 [Candidatus Woykebacteria bacterium]
MSFYLNYKLEDEQVLLELLRLISGLIIALFSGLVKRVKMGKKGSDMVS